MKCSRRLITIETEIAMDKVADSTVANLATDTLDPLVLDFVEWVAGEQRSYADVLDAWKTSCPRLTVWEEASERGFVMRIYVPRHGRPLQLLQQADDFPGPLAG
jgi:hypothetical protein